MKNMLIGMFLILAIKITPSKGVICYDTNIQAFVKPYVGILEFRQKMEVISQRQQWGYGPEEQERIKEIAEKYGLHDSCFYIIFKKESGHSQYAINDSTGASGLIQITPATAQTLKITMLEVRNSDKLRQLDFVEMYFDFWMPPGGYQDIYELYLAVFWPRAIRQSDCYKIGGSIVARQNPAIDKKEGQITVEKVKNFIKS